MRKILVLLLILFMIGIPAVFAVETFSGGQLDESYQMIEDSYDDFNYWFYNGDETVSTTTAFSPWYITLNPIETWTVIYMIKITVPVSTCPTVTGTHSTFELKNGATVIGYGDMSTWLSTPSYREFQFNFDYYNRGSLTGQKTLSLVSPTISVGTTPNKINVGTPSTPYIWLTGPTPTGKHIPMKDVEVLTLDEYYTKIERMPFEINEDFCFYHGRFNFTRYDTEDSRWTYSRLRFLDDNGTVYHDSTSGSANVYDVETITAPLTLEISYGNPVVMVHNYTWTGSSTCFPPSPSITPTPTPTPAAELCGYWSLSVNTSNIKMNEYVLGTLTENDPSNRFDQIDWYRVFPSGQELLALHYVYDPGLFGLGAGWFEVTPTGTAYASSEAQAKENAIQFTTGGGAHHLRAKIYDDVSILPMVYHDYDLVCTLDQVVYVAETTQASNQLGINVVEADTNAFIPSADVKVYDYGTGQWQNKTASLISTTYFNVVPGNTVRILASKTGWLSSDADYVIPSSPGPYLYTAYLKRPLVDIEDKSYAFFNVRDSVTRTALFQANIQLSDGQVQSTLPTGYAGFSVNDSQMYYYTVTKPGYQSYSSTFNITVDTTFPISLVQISPTPTLTYPTTFPTVTITGTSTGATPTVTGTGIFSNTSATLSAADKTYHTTKGIDVWYNNLETLSGLLFVAAVFGAIGLISDSMSRRRRR